MVGGINIMLSGQIKYSILVFTIASTVWNTGLVGGLKQRDSVLA